MTNVRTVVNAASAIALFLFVSLNPAFAGHHAEAEVSADTVEKKMEVMQNEADEAMIKKNLDEMQAKEMDELQDKDKDMEEAEKAAPE